MKKKINKINDFNIGDIVKPYYKGSSPCEVVSISKVFVTTKSPNGSVMEYFPSELVIDKILTRENKLNKLI